jgi:hypothetical protein
MKIYGNTNMTKLMGTFLKIVIAHAPEIFRHAQYNLLPKSVCTFRLPAAGK